MFKVKVLTIGKAKEVWLANALKEYEKRLQGKATFEWCLAKDLSQLAEWAMQTHYIALDPQGTLLTSEEWSEKMESFGARLNFVIGGAEGLTPSLTNQAQFVWSLSPLTFTHQMTRLILAEQIYRALEIQRGSKYHK